MSFEFQHISSIVGEILGSARLPFDEMKRLIEYDMVLRDFGVSLAKEGRTGLDKFDAAAIHARKLTGDTRVENSVFLSAYGVVKRHLQLMDWEFENSDE